MSALEPDSDATGLALLLGADAAAAAAGGERFQALVSVLDELIENSLILLSDANPEDRSGIAENLFEVPVDESSNTIWARIEASLGRPLRSLDAKTRKLFAADLRAAAFRRLERDPIYEADISVGAGVTLRGHLGLVAGSPEGLCRELANAGLPDGPIQFFGPGGRGLLKFSTFHSVLPCA